MAGAYKPDGFDHFMLDVAADESSQYVRRVWSEYVGRPFEKRSSNVIAGHPVRDTVLFSHYHYDLPRFCFDDTLYSAPRYAIDMHSGNVKPWWPLASEMPLELRYAFWHTILTSNSSEEAEMKISIDGRFNEQYDGESIHDVIERCYTDRSISEIEQENKNFLEKFPNPPQDALAQK